MTESEYGKLEQMRQLVNEMVGVDELNNEKTRTVLGDEAEKPAEVKPKAPGHGRKKRDEFGAAKTVSVSHPDLKPGQLCPCGCGWKLYRFKKTKVFRHFVG